METIRRENIKGIILLDENKARCLPQWMLATGNWWWLKCPLKYSYYAPAVRYDGKIHDGGLYIGYKDGGVRPVLEISDFDFFGFEIGETVKVLNRLAYYVGDNQVLLCELIGNSIYDKYIKDEDEAIVIEEFIKDWLEKESEK